MGLMSMYNEWKSKKHIFHELTDIGAAVVNRTMFMKHDNHAVRITTYRIIGNIMTLERKDYTRSEVYPDSFNWASIIVSMNADDDYTVSKDGFTYHVPDKLNVIQIILGQELKSIPLNMNQNAVSTSVNGNMPYTK